MMAPLKSTHTYRSVAASLIGLLNISELSAQTRLEARIETRAKARAEISAQDVQDLIRADGANTRAALYQVTNCKGIAVISHGAGGSESGYSYLAKALQEQAWFTVVPGHRESGIPALRQQMNGKGIKAGLANLITDASAYRGRFMDIEAALAYARQHCHTDTTVLIGHSMGAATTMLLAGAHNKLALQAPSLPFDAYVAMSPQGVGSIFPSHAWSGISKPVMTMTGTKDTELGGLAWETRLDPFKDMQPPCKWSAVIDGATHMSFSGMTRDKQEKELIISTTLHFLDQIKNRQCSLPAVIAGIEIKSK
ncbi:alpha/beta fold hydrolase [Undibacterium cyanobacteriorum]|uniref:Alpha/beta fold hydrolase n=1 Tax=Undibacterium cyanobacteriorum TaxID=3073561 RepID=A0ABY9REM2_9BURK|nr:alpha/beta fold hydrolase [Undibacterium sp. 20NA77.5]WMW79294.1 alpha/beta fold hydrolase [Undibacterium sp. 20NA77.5]